jgi:aspartate beta-hydroxylase
MPTPFELTARTVRSLFGLWIHTPPILEADEWFPEAAQYEERWSELRDEVLPLLPHRADIPRFHELMAEQADISANDGIDWRMLLLRVYGVDQQENLARFPALAELLAAHPHVRTAVISILDAGKHVPPHRGPYRGILRYSLSLVVPTDADGAPLSWLRVDEHRVPWREGRGLLWDDTFEHEVRNEGPSPRVALLLDVARPNMPLVPRAIDRVVTGALSRSRSLERTVAESAVPAPRA